MPSGLCFALSALLSSYSQEPSGWDALSAGSYLARGDCGDPGDSGSQRDLRLMLAFAQRLDEAADHFQRALEIDPGHEDARRNLEAVRAQPRADARREGGAAGRARP